MKKYIITFCLLFSLGHGLLAQSSCQQIDITANEQKKKALLEFVVDATRKGCFYEDKGILHLYIYERMQGVEEWEVTLQIDDRYKDALPLEYAKLEIPNANNTLLILIWHVDTTGKIVSAKVNIEAIQACLDQVIGDRVYIRPPYTARKREILLPNGKKVWVNEDSTAPNRGCACYITFNKDGSYTKKSM